MQNPRPARTNVHHGVFTTATHWGRYRVVVKGGEIRWISPLDDPEPATIGYRRTSYDQGRGRVLRPMVRTSYLRNRDTPARRRGDDTFTPVSWERALDLVAEEIKRAHDTRGPSSIFGGSYGWASAGRFHHAQSQVHRFLNVAGGYTPSIDSYSFAAMARIVPHVLGTSANEHLLSVPTWEEIAEHVDLLLAFGGLPAKNAQVNPGGVHMHRSRSGLRMCAEAGVELVNISPQRSDLDIDEAQWVRVRPNTDTALMLALTYEVWAAGDHDAEFLRECCVGAEDLVAYLSGSLDGVVKDASWAAEVCDIPDATIRDLARRIVGGRTLITVSWSIQRGDHGEQPFWAAIALAAMAGHLGRPQRGVALGFGTHHSTGARQRKLPVAAFPQKVRELPEIAPIPVARIADMLLGPGQEIDFDGRRVTFPDIDLVYWCGGNPFHHHQDLNRLVEAWQRPRTIIVHESFWTATAKHADIVLPVSTYLERNDVAIGRHESHLSVMHAAVDPPGEARDDYAVFADLADRLGFRREFTEGRSADEWVRHLYDTTRDGLAAAGMPIPDFRTFWAAGEVTIPLPEPDRRADPLALLREDPMRNPLATPSGKVELTSATIESFAYDDCPGHPTWLEPQEWLGSTAAERFPLHLLSPQPRTRLHSQYDQADHSAESKVRGREPIHVNPDDATARHIRAGDVVRVFNDRGQCLAGAVIDPGVRSGVVVLHAGAWYDPIEPGGLDAHGNPNVLTFDKGTSKLAQGPSSGTALVQVERFDGPLPPVRAFDPPAQDTQ
jgi:biotin/methionine sulfoxide reductase